MDENDPQWMEACFKVGSIFKLSPAVYSGKHNTAKVSWLLWSTWCFQETSISDRGRRDTNNQGLQLCNMTWTHEKSYLSTVQTDRQTTSTVKEIKLLLFVTPPGCKQQSQSAQLTFTIIKTRYLISTHSHLRVEVGHGCCLDVLLPEHLHLHRCVWEPGGEVV